MVEERFKFVLHLMALETNDTKHFNFSYFQNFSLGIDKIVLQICYTYFKPSEILMIAMFMKGTRTSFKKLRILASTKSFLQLPKFQYIEFLTSFIIFTK